jgi:ABC-2 type transport system permease protein
VFVEFLKVGSDVPNWPVAMLLGIVLWNFFNEVTNNGLGSIVGRGDMIRKINFPKYVIVLASSISAFINLLLNFIIIIVFMIISGVEFHASSLLVIWYVVQLSLALDLHSY